MTDDEFEQIWSLERHHAPRGGVPSLNAMKAYVATYPEGVDILKLLRRYEVEGYSKGNVQLGIQRLTDFLCEHTDDNRIVVRRVAARPTPEPRADG